MLKSAFYIFTVAVLLGGAASEMHQDLFSSFMCFSSAIMKISPAENFFTDAEESCQNVETKFAEAHQEIRKCTVRAMDTSELVSLYKEFCDKRSDYRQKFNRQESCIRQAQAVVDNSCNSIQQVVAEAEKPRKVGDTIETLCERSTKDMAKCMPDTIGESCGSEAKEVYVRITTASEPLYKLSCLMGHDAMLAVLDAGTTANSAFIWVILLGLLITVKWW